MRTSVLLAGLLFVSCIRPATPASPDAGPPALCRVDMVFSVQRAGERFIITISDPSKVEVRVQHQ